MKPERINEVIAEHCGWVVRYRNTTIGRERVVFGPDSKTAFSESYRVKRPEESFGTHELPDYYHDLNAIHEAVKHLSKNEGEYQPGGFGLYLAALEEVCDYDLDAQIEATAAQRAEAFVKAINRWEEVEEKDESEEDTQRKRKACGSAA